MSNVNTILTGARDQRGPGDQVPAAAHHGHLQTQAGPQRWLGHRGSAEPRGHPQGGAPLPAPDSPAKEAGGCHSRCQAQVCRELGPQTKV